MWWQHVYLWNVFVKWGLFPCTLWVAIIHLDYLQQQCPKCLHRKVQLWNKCNAGKGTGGLLRWRKWKLYPNLHTALLDRVDHGNQAVRYFWGLKNFVQVSRFPTIWSITQNGLHYKHGVKTWDTFGIKKFPNFPRFHRMDFKQLLADIWVLAYCLQGRGSLKCIKADCKHFQTPIYLDSNPLWAYMIKQIFWQKSTFCTLALTPGMFWNIQRHHWDLIWKFWLYCWSIREVLNQ